jgi:enoyl-[acyl-carrier protein] reductase II
VPAFSNNRVLRDTGARFPIFNAPVGYFARARLAGAVSAAGGMGLMEMSSTGVDETADEADAIVQRTDNPFGLHLFIRALEGRKLLDEVLDWALGRATFLAACAGNPNKVMPRVLETGIPLYHQIGSLDEARKAVDAGVSGLIVEGAEAGGLRSTRSPHLFTLLQQVRAAVDVPLVAAGGIVDGVGMAAAFALGAEGVMMGTRFMSCADSPVHENWKQAVADCDVTLNIDPGMPNLRMRVVRNELSESFERGDVDPKGNPYGGPFMAAFRDGELDKAMVGCGESATLITEIKTAAEIVDETMTGFWREVDRLAALRA